VTLGEWGQVNMAGAATDITIAESHWRRLYLVGGAAAMLAGVLFRRNIAAELSLFGVQKPPLTVLGWYALLQDNRLLGLAHLNVFDLVNYALVGTMFLALCLALRRVSRSGVVITAATAFTGIAVYFSSNTALSMLSLSDQYASATTEPHRISLLAAGEAMLAMNRFTGVGAHPGAGGYASLMLVASAGIMASVLMLRSGLFGRTAGYIGVLAGGLDVAYCVTYVLMPSVDSEALALTFIPAAGLCWMVWHIIVGWKLIRMGRRMPSNPRFQQKARPAKR
jgi:hypothetical protein